MVLNVTKHGALTIIYMEWILILKRTLITIIIILLTGIFIDFVISPRVLSPSIATDIAGSATQTLRTIYDAFPGISRAIPGTFQRILLRWINIRASISTTTSTLESSTSISLDSTSVTEIIANAARAARTASFVVAAVYFSCAVAILISRYYW
jgi:hypothetical protein